MNKLITITATAAATLALTATAASAADVAQDAKWYAPVKSQVGLSTSVAVMGDDSRTYGTVSTSTPAVCSVTAPADPRESSYRVRFLSAGTCVLDGVVPASPGYLETVSTHSIQVNPRP